MKITRAIAFGIMLSALGVGALHAQSLRKSAPPSEFPPASYKGKQYVDSRGCIYIRAGIDGNVNWVPRVSRSRKQICGFKPTGVAGARPTPAPKPAVKPVIITAKPAPVTTPTPAPARVIAKAPPKVQAVTPRTVPAAVVARPKPARIVRRTQPAKIVRRVPKVAPVQAPVQVPAPARSDSCGNASAFSQQFINKPNRRHKVRCGPQAEAPITYGRGEDQSSITVPLGTRVVRRHIFDRRQNTTNVTIPKGYRTVWQDGRLNPNRAERTLRPAQIVANVTVPAGYRRIADKDGRLNAARGARTAAGNLQTGRIWNNSVPRTLVQVPTAGQIVTVPAGSARAQLPHTTVSRTARAVNLTSTAAVAQGTGKRLFIRVATYASESDARSVAKSLARRGLPMNLGHVKSSNSKVVLAGPFASQAQADAALARVHGAGYRNARLNR